MKGKLYSFLLGAFGAFLVNSLSGLNLIYNILQICPERNVPVQKSKLDLDWIGALMSKETLVTALLVGIPLLLIVALQLIRYRKTYMQSFLVLRQKENHIADLERELLNAQTTMNENKVDLVLFREITSILGQTHDFQLVLRSAFSRMLELLSIDFGILCLGKSAQIESKICLGTSESLLEVLDNFSKRTIVLEENPQPLQTVYFADFQKSRDLQAIKQAHSLLGFACKVKSNLVGNFLVGFHETHVYTQAELDALQFCADQFAISYEISKQLLYTQELAQLRQEYMSNVSHELRTPLTTIYGYLNILRSYPQELLKDQEKDEMFSVMTDECHRLIRLINNLLLSVQVEQEDFVQRFNPVSISLGQVVSQALRFMDRELKIKSIKVVTDIPADLALIEGNSDLLYQVFQNLIANSIKFCTKDPKIEIVARDEDQEVVVYVADNGIGIEEKDLPKIFQKFYRSQSQASKRPGLGIGLYLVQKLVALHHGEIRVSSEPNRGTMFIMKFPKIMGRRSLAHQAGS